jgi:hypothetical protein
MTHHVSAADADRQYRATTGPFKSSDVVAVAAFVAMIAAGVVAASQTVQPVDVFIAPGPRWTVDLADRGDVNQCRSAPTVSPSGPAVTGRPARRSAKREGS